MNKQKISYIFNVVTLVFTGLVFLYAHVYFIWRRCIDNRLRKYGTETVATVIRKYDRCAQYDILYDSTYYRNWIQLTNSAYKRIRIGERFHALVLPEMLKYHHDNGITPRYVKIILIPLPPEEQDYEAEIQRINSYYHLNYRLDTSNQ